jgi:alpha-beta hydrolase superfamily lysophospholipase
LAEYKVETFTAGDGYAWQYRRYACATPRAHVVCVHGIQSHSGWYEYSCTRLSRAGFTVSFLDRRGSGMNREGRGDAPSFRRLLDDLAEFLLVVRAEGRPVFLLAISWGGKLALALQRRAPGLVDGLVLIGPGLSARVRPSLAERLRIVGARLTNPTRLFPIPLSDPELFTATPHWLDFLRQDALALHRATARLLIESARLDAYLRFVPPYVRAPVLLLLAGKDRIIDNDRTRAYVQRLATPDKKVIEYPEAHHSLEFEPDPDGFVNDVVGWLEARLAKPQAAGAS